MDTSRVSCVHEAKHQGCIAREVWRSRLHLPGGNELARAAAARCHWPGQGVNWKLTSRGVGAQHSDRTSIYLFTGRESSVLLTSPERVWFMAARAERRITKCQMGPQSIPAHAIHSLWFSVRCTLSRINWMRPGRRIKWRRIKVELPSSRGYTPTHTHSLLSSSQPGEWEPSARAPKTPADTYIRERTKARLTTRLFLNAFILGRRISRVVATWYADCFGIWSLLLNCLVQEWWWKFECIQFDWLV